MASHKYQPTQQPRRQSEAMIRTATQRLTLALTLAVMASTAHAGVLSRLFEHVHNPFISSGSTSQTFAAQNLSVQAGFSPGDAESLVVQAIDQAHASIRVAAYSFTSRPIARALMQAHKRGVDVKAVMDKSQSTERYSSARFLANVGIPVRIDSRYAIMHNKFLVIDGSTVETGSFNYTYAAARRNAENVLIVRGSHQLAAVYERQWDRLWNESTGYAAHY